MSLVIRFRQQGCKNKRTFRLVVAEKKSRRDGKYIANLGHYNPKLEELVIVKEEVERWLKVGAMPTERAEQAFKRNCPDVLKVLKK